MIEPILKALRYLDHIYVIQNRNLAPVVPPAVETSLNLPVDYLVYPACTHAQLVAFEKLRAAGLRNRHIAEPARTVVQHVGINSCFQPTVPLSKFAMREVGCTAISGLTVSCVNRM